VRSAPPHARDGSPGNDEKFIEMLQQSRPDCARRVLFLVLQRHGYDDVGVHGPERNAQLVGHFLSPALGLAQRVLVADDDGGTDFVGEGQQAMVRVAPEDEADAAFAQSGSNVGQPVGEEVIVAEVRACDERIQPEEDHDWEPEIVAQVDSDVERWIIHGALGALHPVHDATPVGIRFTFRTDCDARIGGQILILA
jgi:hypothetical protein